MIASSTVWKVYEERNLSIMRVH